MDRTIRATDAARQFSEILNQVKFNGARFTVERGGKPVARIGPVEDAGHPCRLKDLKALLRALPHLGDDTASFAADLRAVVDAQPSLPEGQAWD